MSAKDHISKQFTTLYRGLKNVSHPDELDSELIGPHWTHTKEKAQEFAQENGSVVTANVPNEHIMYSSDTGYQHPDFFENYGFGNSNPYKVMFGNEGEEETFVRPNVPVDIIAMETHPKNPIRDKWSFEKPLRLNSEKLYAFSAKKNDGDITEYYTDEP